MQKHVYDFDDYRDFLDYCFKERKKKVPTTSFQGFALASQRSRAYLKNVLSKKRHLSLEAITDVSQYFNFSEYEEEYVLYQFLATQVEIKNVKTHFEKTLKILKQQIIQSQKRQNQKKQDAITPEQKSELFGNLKDVIAATHARDKSFKDNHSWISQSLVGVAKVNEAEALEISNRLFKSGVVKKRSDGVMDVVEDQFCKIHPAEFNYFKSALEMTADAITDISVHEPSRFELGVLAFSDQTFQKVKEELIDFAERIGQYSRQDNSPDKRVFLSNFSLLCVTKNETIKK